MTSTAAMSAALKSRMAAALEADVRERICVALKPYGSCLDPYHRGCSACRDCMRAALAGVDEFCANNAREVPA